MAEVAVKAPGPGPGENEGVNVQVLLRCRPLSDKEIAERTPQVISCNEALRETTLYQNVFNCDSTQEKLYKTIVPIVQEVMDGFNCTIFAYGQTGTGKTYTMEGGPRRSDDGKSLSAEAGVIPRSIKQIFDTIEANNTDSTVKVTFLELYNEELTDLLSMDDVKDDSKRLRLLEDRSGVVAQGLDEVVVKSATEIYQVLDRGTAKRRTGETWLNKRSSRSHSVFSITIHMREVTPDGEDVVKVGKLNLVDLAGSENISRSGAKDGRAREAGSINQSLLTLGRVITALVEHSGHIPYRDSKLTRLLRESLGGKTKTCIIATIAPTVQCQEETISTLDYAHRAKNIRNRPEVNQKISKNAMIKEMSGEMEKMRMELIAQREKNGVYISIDKHQQDEIERVQLRDTVKALREEMKLEQEGFAQTLEAQKAEADKTTSRLEAELAATREDLDDVTRKLLGASRTITERQYVVTAHRQAEQEVVEHAEAMRGELAAAARDVGELFTAVEELAEVHGEDRGAMKHVQELIGARMGSLTASLTGALDSQRRQLGAMGDTLAAFRESKQRSLQQLTERVGSVQATVTLMREAVERRALEADGAAASALGRATEAAAAHVSGAVAASQALEAATRAAIEALGRSIEQQAGQLQAFAEEQASCAASCCESMAAAMQRLSGSFGGLQAAAVQTKAAAEQQAEQLSAELEGFAGRQKEACARQQAELVAQIALLVQAFAEQRTGEVAREVQGLRTRVREGGEAVCSQLGSIASAASSGVESAQLNSAAAEAFRQVSDALLPSYCRVAMFSCYGNLSSRYGNGIAFSQDMAVSCTQGAAAVQAATRTCIKEAEEAAASTQEAHAGICRDLEASAADDARSADALAGNCTSLVAALTAAGEEQAAGASALESEVDASLHARFAVQLQAAAPDRRPLNVPPASSIRELRCAPEEKLLAKCHAEYPQIFSAAAQQQLPGSPRSTFARTSSAPIPLGLNENDAQWPPSAGGGVGALNGGSVPPSPKSSSAAGLRSRIPSKPSLVASSPASVKDLAVNVTTRQQLADRTNSKQGSILSDWPA
ncbi:kinesin-related protein [Tetrabaena socialis]|uniref:Kinesin-related protein n=1 Tax=Tetrabaena socialis TaxID=47790 RepID=A0A2J7ZPY9_9CHLO|nr:kinesin-related protein [Tetrabaena socialis]|eukprot:PNH02333.1 kinesin-related protein [Tetrabaena socialis]